MSQQKGTSSSKSYKLYIISGLIIALLGVGGFFAYREYDSLKKENQKLSNPQEAAKLESERIRQEISTLIEVPQDEEPTIATVVDPAKLGDQAFFAKAQKDDRVVIYANAKKAILYRPSTKKIIEVAPLNIGNNSTTTSPAGTQPTDGTAIDGQSQSTTPAGTDSSTQLGQ